MDTILIQDKLKAQAEQIIFVAGFQSIVETIRELEKIEKPDAEKALDKAMLEGFLQAALLDATNAGFVGEA